MLKEFQMQLDDGPRIWVEPYKYTMTPGESHIVSVVVSKDRFVHFEMTREEMKVLAEGLLEAAEVVA